MNTGENLNQNSDNSDWNDLESTPFNPARAEALQALNTTTSGDVRAVNYFLGEKGRNAILDFLEQKSETTYANLDTAEEAVDFFKDYTDEFYQNHPRVNDGLYGYTGLDFGAMNSITRGYWDYDQVGLKTPEKVERAKRYSETLSKTIAESPELPADLTVYRGTNIESFRDHDIQSLEELSSLKGQLFYEKGFTSTSIVREKSFFDKQLNDTYRRACNVEVEILVPKESHDGVPINIDQRNHEEFARHTEFIINSSSLFRIKNVDVDKDANTAHIVMELIPKSVWDRNF